APMACQAAIAVAVRDDWHHARQSHAPLAARRAAIAHALKDNDVLSWMPTNAGFFAFMRVRSSRPTMELALDLIDHAHVMTIPGSCFGKTGEGHLRLSYGAASLHDLE